MATTFEIDPLHMGSETGGAANHSVDSSSPFPFTIFSSSGPLRWEESTQRGQNPGFYASQSAPWNQPPSQSLHPFTDQSQTTGCLTAGDPHYHDDGRNTFLHDTQSQVYPSVRSSEYSFTETRNASDACYYLPNMQREHGISCSDRVGVDPSGLSQPSSSSPYSSDKSQQAPFWFQAQAAPVGDPSGPVYGYMFPGTQGGNRRFPEVVSNSQQDSGASDVNATLLPQLSTGVSATTSSSSYGPPRVTTNVSVIRSPQESGKADAPGSHSVSSLSSFSPDSQAETQTGEGDTLQNETQMRGQGTTGEAGPSADKFKQSHLERASEMGTSEKSLKAAAEALYSSCHRDSGQYPTHSSPDFNYHESGKGKIRAHPYSVQERSNSVPWSGLTTPFSLPRTASASHNQSAKAVSSEQGERSLTDRLALGDFLSSGFPHSSDIQLGMKEGAGVSTSGNVKSEGYTLSRKPTESTTQPTFSSSSSQSFSPPLTSTRGSPRLEPKPAPAQMAEEEHERGVEDKGFFGFVLPRRQQPEQHGDAVPFSGALQMPRTMVVGGEGAEQQAPSTMPTGRGEQGESQENTNVYAQVDYSIHAQSSQRNVEGDAAGKEEANGQGIECLGAERKTEEGDRNRRGQETETVPPARRKRGPSQPAKMYFHKKKEAWRAEVLIDGTKRQKSFSCKVYGEPRARMLCEWARRFARDFGRLPSNQDVANYIPCLAGCPPGPRANESHPDPSQRTEASSYSPALFPYSFSSSGAFPENDVERFCSTYGGNPSPPASAEQGGSYPGSEWSYPGFSNESSGVPDTAQTSPQMIVAHNDSQPNGQNCGFSTSFHAPEGWREMNARETWQAAHAGREEATGNFERPQNTEQMTTTGRVNNHCYMPYGQMPASYYQSHGVNKPENESLTFPIQGTDRRSANHDSVAWAARPDAFSGATHPHKMHTWEDDRRQREDMSSSSFENHLSSAPGPLGWPCTASQGGVEEGQRHFTGGQDPRSDCGTSQPESEQHEQGSLRPSPQQHFYSDGNASVFASQPVNAVDVMEQVKRMREGRDSEGMRSGDVLAPPQMPTDSSGQTCGTHFSHSGPQTGPGAHACRSRMSPHSMNGFFQPYGPSGVQHPGGSQQGYSEEVPRSTQYHQNPQDQSPNHAPSKSFPRACFSSAPCTGMNSGSFPPSSGSAGVPESSIMSASSSDLPFSPFPSPFISDGPFCFPQVPFAATPYGCMNDEGFKGPSYFVPSVQSANPSSSESSCPSFSPWFKPHHHETLTYYPPSSVGLCAARGPSPGSGSTLCHRSSSLAYGALHGASYDPQTSERGASASGARSSHQPLSSVVELAAQIAAMALSNLENQSFDSLLSQTLQDLKREEAGVWSASSCPSVEDQSKSPDSFRLPIPLLHQANRLLNQLEDPFSGFSLDPWGQAFPATILPATSDYQRYSASSLAASTPAQTGMTGNTFSASSEGESTGALAISGEGVNGDAHPHAASQSGQNTSLSTSQDTSTIAGHIIGARHQNSGESCFDEKGEKEGSRRKTSGCGEEAEGFSAFVQKRREMNIAAGAQFEELDGLKSLTRPRGGRTKRFNVGKKPFSGVRGIYFQQGAWKVRYRGDQEEVLKIFPYTNGDFDSMWAQFSLARQFLRQVIAKGRQLHDSDGEGLSDEEPAWVLRRDAASANSASRRAELGRSRRGQLTSSSRSSSLPGSQSYAGPFETSGTDNVSMCMRTRRHDLATSDGLDMEKNESSPLLSAAALSPRRCVSGQGDRNVVNGGGAATDAFLLHRGKPQERQAGKSDGACSRRPDVAVDGLPKISQTEFFEPIFFPALFGPTSEKWGPRSDVVRDEMETLEQQRCVEPREAPKYGSTKEDNGDNTLLGQGAGENKRGSAVEAGDSGDCLVLSGDNGAKGGKAEADAGICLARDKRRKLSGEHRPVDPMPDVKLPLEGDLKKREKEVLSELCPTEGTCGSRKESGESEVEETLSPFLGCGASVSTTFPLSFASSFEKEVSESQQGEKDETEDSHLHFEGEKPASIRVGDAFEVLTQEPACANATFASTPLSREKEFHLVASYPWDMSAGMTNKTRSDWDALPHLHHVLQDRNDVVNSSWSF